MDFWLIFLVAFIILTTCYCCCIPNGYRGQQPSSTIKPPRTVLPVHAPPPNNYCNNCNNPLYCPPPIAPTATSGTTYTNSMGIQLQVAPPAVVNMSPDAPLPVYTPYPPLQDIQFSSHPRPTVVTTIAEDPEPVEPLTRT